MPPPPRIRAAQRQRIAERRRQVAALYRAGVHDQRVIAAQLGVSRQTIGLDLRALAAEWRERAAEDIAAARGLDLERLDSLLTALWPQALRGDLRSLDRVLAILTRRAALLGLESPTRLEHSGPGGQPLFGAAHLDQLVELGKRLVEASDGGH